MQLDPVTLEILSTKMAAASEEMAHFLKRSARSLYVQEADDFATGLADHSGRFFSYPLTLGASGFFDYDCGPTIEAAGRLDPGDVVITNHPYLSKGLATHLPDLHIIKAFFHEERIICYGWAFIHASDVGGRVPSSVSPSNDEIFQEGVLIPPMKLVRGGVVSEDVIAILRANSRTPDANVGDVRAMLAAVAAGERRVARIIEQHGAAVFAQAIPDIVEYTALRAREVLRSIPDGRYEFWDYLDSDFVTPMPLRVRVAMTAADGMIELDFDGTDPQVAAAFNLPTCGRRHSQLEFWLTSYLFSRNPTLPANYGLFQSISMRVPPGTVVNPLPPAAVGVRHGVAVRTMDVLNGAMGQALPDYMPACACGVIIPTVFAEPEDARGDRNVVVVQRMMGGGGAHRGGDGVDSRFSGPMGTKATPLESVEVGAAVVVHRLGLRHDSGGPGQWRGGTGTEITFSPLVEGGRVLGRGMDRFRFVPWGVAGGKAGQAARTVLNYGRPDERDLGRIDMIELEPGDTITVLTPGGGGYGDPFRREPALVLQDVVRGLVSPGAAETEYGVIIRDGRVDEAATRESRGRRSNAVPGGFDFGHNRAVWEAVFDDAKMKRIVAALMKIPLSARRSVRRRMFGQVFELLHGNAPLDLAALRHAAQGAEAELTRLESEAA